MTVLPDEEDVALIIQRDNDDRARMFDDIISGLTAIRQAQGVATDSESAARIDNF
jgi:hypothetical protein